MVTVPSGATPTWIVRIETRWSAVTAGWLARSPTSGRKLSRWSTMARWKVDGSKPPESATNLSDMAWYIGSLFTNTRSGGGSQCFFTMFRWVSISPFRTPPTYPFTQPILVRELPRLRDTPCIPSGCNNMML